MESFDGVCYFDQLSENCKIQKINKLMMSLSKNLSGRTTSKDFKYWVKEKFFPGINSLEENAARLEELRKMAEDATSDVPMKVLRAFMWMTDVVAHLYTIVNSDSLALKALSVSAIVYKCYGVCTQMDEILKQLKEVFHVQEQGVDTSICVGIAAAFVTALLSLIGVKISHSDEKYVRGSAKQKWLDTLVNVGKVGAVALTATRVWSMVKTGLGVAVDFFLDGPSEDLEQFTDDEMEQWANTWNKYNARGAFSEEKLWTFSDGVSNFAILASLVEKAYVVKKKATVMPTYNRVRVQIAEEILRVYQKAYKSKDADSLRVEPVGVYLYGVSGVGKSVLSSAILPFVVMKETGLIANYSEAECQVYTAPSDPQQRFKDRYHGQWWYQVDDFASSAKDEDSLDLINLISVSAHVVNKADLGDKGQLFTSKFVCVTTNKSFVTNNAAIRNPEALVRRFPLAYTVKVRGPRPFSFEAFTDACASDKTHEHFLDVCEATWEFEPINILNGTATGPAIGFREMRSKVSSLYQSRIGSYGKLTDVLSAHFQIGGADVDAKCDDWMHAYSGCKDTLTAREAQRLFSVVLAHPEYYGFSDDQDLVDHVQGQQPGKFYTQLREVFQKSLDKTEDNVNWSGLMTWIVGIGAGIACVGLVIYGIIKLFRSFNAIEEQIYQPEFKPKSQKPKVKGKMYFQGPFKDVHEKIRRNMFRIELRDETNVEGPGMWALALNSKVLAIPRHFIDRCEGCVPHIIVKGVAVPFTVDPRVVYLSEGRDLALVWLLGANADGARDITSFLRSKPVRPWRTYCLLGAQPLNAVHVNSTVVFHGRVFERLSPERLTIGGDCGRPYVDLNDNRNPIVGLHSLLVEDKDVGLTPIYKEDYDKFKIHHEGSHESSFDITECAQPWWQITGMPVLGHIKVDDDILSHHEPAKTDYVRSSIACDKFYDGYLPAARRKVEGVDRHPLYTGSQKYALGTRAVVGVSFLKQSVDHYCTKLPKGQGQILTDEETLNGCEGLSALVLKTSAGIYSKWTTDGKNAFLESVDGVIRFKEQQPYIPLLKKTLPEQWRENETMLANSVRPPYVWVSTLKDELRKENKVLAGETRVFEQPPLDFTLSFRKHFGHFLGYFRANHGFPLHHAIGIDKETEWAEIERQIGDLKLLDLDFKDFDGHVPQIAFDFFVAITDHYYGDHSVARHTLVDCLRSAVLLVGSVSVQTLSGNKSGNPATDVFNSIVNVWFVYLSYLVGMSAHSTPSLVNFDDHVRFLTYGDDVLAASDDVGQKYLCADSIRLVADHYGMKVTSGDKTDDLSYKDIENISFLKSSFVHLAHKGYLVVACPIPIEVIYREINWEKKQHRGDRLILVQRAEAARALAFHHGEDVYRKIDTHLTRCGLPSEKDWEDRFFEILDKQRHYVSPGCVYQGLEDLALSFLSPISEIAGVSGVLEPVLDFVRKVTGSEQDSSRLQEMRVGDFGLSDRPTRATTLAFRMEDECPDQSDVLGIETPSMLQRLQVPARIATWHWKTDTAVKHCLGWFSVDPMACNWTDTGTDPNKYRYFNSTPLSYHGSQYEFWRGSIRMEIEVICTPFHQGQLLVAFNPDDVDLTEKYDDVRTCFVATIDLSTSNRTVMEIPFVTNCDYLRCRKRPDDTTTEDNALGRVAVFVQNVLQANSNVSDTIDVNFYISAGEKFVFKTPRACRDQIYIEGKWQMEENTEVIKNENVSVPPEIPLVGVREVALRNVARSFGVEPASYENILDREYLLSSNVEWNSTQAVETSLVTIRYPTDITTNDKFAPAGLVHFHRLIRSGVEVTVRLNAIPFHAGMLIIWYNMGDEAGAQTSQQAITQLPHVFLNPSAEKSATLRIPYAYFRRFFYRTTGWGAINVSVWNVLRSTGTPVVRISTWAKLIDPYVGVKCVYQMEKPSASRTREVVEGIGFKGACSVEADYAVGDHMDYKHLLSRPALIISRVINTQTTEGDLFTNLLQGYEFGAKAHLWWLATWGFRSGGNRIRVLTTASHIVNVLFELTFDYGVNGGFWSDMASGVEATSSWYGGARVDKIYDGGFVVEIPHYSVNPMLNTPFVSIAGNGEALGKLFLRYSWYGSTSAITPKIGVWVLHSVADDFRLYFPLSMPRVRYKLPTAS